MEGLVKHFKSLVEDRKEQERSNKRLKQTILSDKEYLEMFLNDINEIIEEGNYWGEITDKGYIYISFADIYPDSTAFGTKEHRIAVANAFLKMGFDVYACGDFHKTNVFGECTPYKSEKEKLVLYYADGLVLEIK